MARSARPHAGASGRRRPTVASGVDDQVTKQPRRGRVGVGRGRILVFLSSSSSSSSGSSSRSSSSKREQGERGASRAREGAACL